MDNKEKLHPNFVDLDKKIGDTYPVAQQTNPNNSPTNEGVKESSPET